MRDPGGTVRFSPDLVIRDLRASLPVDHFLYSKKASDLAAEGLLIPWIFTDTHTIESPRVPFVTYPYEWTDGQLRSAAALTLDLSSQILSDGFELKDASAWNVIFDGTRPVFCDHLSFQSIERKNWWAFGQFVRHFILPLAVAKSRGLHGYQAFGLYRDGLPPDVARQLLGPGRFLHRFWPLTLGLRMQPTRQTVKSDQKPTSSVHKNIYEVAKWMIAGTHPKKPDASHWSGYITERSHYPESASAQKSHTIARWLQVLRPKWVLDLGCNTGEFTLLAAAQGSKVIAIDLDHDCVDRLFRDAPNRADVYPLRADIDDLVGGRGWAGSEYASLLQRLADRADVVLMLALIHHLAISAGIPFDEIARFAYGLSRDVLIVELLSDTDPLVKKLAGQRDRSADEFSLARQMAAFERWFILDEEVVLSGTQRRLMLYRRSKEEQT